MVTKVKEEVTMYRGNGGQAAPDVVAAQPVEREVAKAAPANVARIDAQQLKKLRGPDVDVPEAHMESFNSWLDDYMLVLSDQVDTYKQRQAQVQLKQRRGIKPAIGEPTVGPYVAWDVLSLSPIELLSLPLPANAPNKILRGTAPGSLTIAAFVALLWTNPTVDVANGFAIPANIQLGGRTCRLSFDQLNITNAASGPNFTLVFPLPAGVPPIMVIPVFFITPNVNTPELYELNVTADIVESPQPFSAFATWHADIDSEPSWFGGFPPTTGPELQHDVQNRYMIYPF